MSEVLNQSDDSFSKLAVEVAKELPNMPVVDIFKVLAVAQVKAKEMNQ